MEQDDVKKVRLLNKELRRQAKEFDEEKATPTAVDDPSNEAESAPAGCKRESRGRR